MDNYKYFVTNNNKVYWKNIRCEIEKVGGRANVFTFGYGTINIGQVYKCPMDNSTCGLNGKVDLAILTWESSHGIIAEDRYKLW